MNIHSTPSVLVPLTPERSSVLAPVARCLLDGLVSGGDVRALPEGVVLAGPDCHARARVTVARALEGFSAHLDRAGDGDEPVVFRNLREPGAVGFCHPLAVSGLVCENSALPPGRSDRFLRGFVAAALRRASGYALRQEVVFARFGADDKGYVALLAHFDDGMFLERLGGERGFVEAMCHAMAAQLVPQWPDICRVLHRAGDVALDAFNVTATLPLLGPARDDMRVYRWHLERMLGRSARCSFGATGRSASNLVGLHEPTRALSAHVAAKGGVPDLHLRCCSERFYDCTRGALLAQLVQSCLHHLVECGADDGSQICIDAWPIQHTCGLARHVAPLSDQETLWAFTAYVDEVSAEHHPELSAEQVVSRIRACVELVLCGVPGARWWSSKFARLIDVPEIMTGTDVRNARRYHFACAVLDSDDVGRLWLDVEALSCAIEEQFRLQEAEYTFH